MTDNNDRFVYCNALIKYYGYLTSPPFLAKSLIFFEY